jgi:hypothetical protein
MGRRALEALGCEPVQVTALEEPFIDNGVVYAQYWCGPTAHAISLGPRMTLKWIAALKRTLANGEIVPIPLKGEGFQQRHD